MINFIVILLVIVIEVSLLYLIVIMFLNLNVGQRKHQHEINKSGHPIYITVTYRRDGSENLVEIQEPKRRLRL